ncbi:MAG: SPOR domain-containing protein, partial [Bacteroidetes bacterium]|nr:SPOR domain-containing protein [Bacteroidota bacterium]
KWTKPKNLGNLLNSPKNDNHPFYLKEKNNKEYLYFSSDREDGFGGYDIYRAEYSDGLWQDVQLLPAPINTAGNEDSYTYDLETQTAYVSSDRSDSKGGFDIYRIKPLNLLLFITVKDNDTKDPLGFAFLELFEKNKKVTESVTNTDGVGKVNISPNKTYNVNVSKEGYRPQSLDFNTDKLKNEDSVVLSANLVKDPKFNIENSFSSVSTTNFILFTGNMTDASTGKIIKPEARITNLSNNKTKLIEYDETGNFNIKLLVNNNYKIIISNQGVKINDNITTLGLEKGSVKTKKYVLTGTKFKTTENSITSPALVSDAIKKLYFEDKQPTLATETLAVKQDTSKNNLVAANTLTPTINKPTELVKTEPLKDSIINKATETVSNTTNAKTEDVTVVTDENKNNTLIAEAISKITTTSKIIPFELGTELDPSKEKPTLTNAGNTYYKIQIGSYRDVNANVNKLRTLDKIEEKFAYGQYFYRMGNYASPEEAFQMLKNVKDEGYYLAFILQYKDDYIVKVIK